MIRAAAIINPTAIKQPTNQNPPIKKHQTTYRSNNPLVKTQPTLSSFPDSFSQPNNNSFSAGDDAFALQLVSEIYANEVISEDFDGGFLGLDGPILPPPMEMEPEEGFALREWRRYAFEFHFVSLIDSSKRFGK